MIISKIKLTSFENASLLRKLTILYFLMSIIPISFLYFLYLQLLDYKRIVITEERFAFIFFLVMIGVSVGYFAMRRMIVSIIDITQRSRESLQDFLGAEKIKSISASGSNEVAILAKSFNEITSRLEENVRNLELAKKTLHSVLARVGEGISSMESIDSFLNLIVETVTEALQAENGVLLLKDEKKGDFFVKAIFGRTDRVERQSRISPDNPFFAEVLSSKDPMIIEKIPRDAGFLNTILRPPVLCATLVLHDQPLGVIAVFNRKTEVPFDVEEKNLLNNLALQTAVAVENSRLNEDAEKTYFETISALAMAVEAKDVYSRGHSDRVANYALAVANELNLKADDLKSLRDAAKLHDLGKIGVTDRVLKKPARLTTSEMEMMRKHPEIGEGIIKPIRSLRNLCDLIRHHHEKLDGSGYPDGLKGDQLGVLVRILQVADIYDALTTARPYRDPFNKEQAVEALRSMREQIDQNIVDVLSRVA